VTVPLYGIFLFNAGIIFDVSSIIDNGRGMRYCLALHEISALPAVGMIIFELKNIKGG